MRLAVFGTTGRSGIPLVVQALERGHQVVALARSAEKARKLLPASDRLTVVEGDLLDPAALEKVVQGADAVVNVAGHVKGSPKDLQQRAIAAILDAMRRHGVRRLVTLTGAGVRAEGDQPKLADKLIRFALEMLQGDILADSEAYVGLVRRSELDWTVVRAPRLTDDAPKGYRAALHVGGGTGTKLARADLARFILEEMEKGEYLRQQPIVFN